MKKIKWVIMTVAVVFSIGAAFGSRTRPLGQLYYWTGAGYAPAGYFGVTYVCETPSSAVCTYSYNSSTNQYTPVTVNSEYTPIGLAPAEPKPDTKSDSKLILQKGK
jgi:hypothetical protein